MKRSKSVLARISHLNFDVRNLDNTKVTLQVQLGSTGSDVLNIAYEKGCRPADTAPVRTTVNTNGQGVRTVPENGIRNISFLLIQDG